MTYRSWSVRALGALLLALPASAAPRPLSLAEAVELALRVDPIVSEARIQEDRSSLGVVRAQLDRVSLKVDGAVQELWNKSNILGSDFCSISVLTDKATCIAATGTWYEGGDASPSAGQGLFNLSANLSVPLFTGFRITNSVKRAQLVKESALVRIRQTRKDTALAVARAYWAVRRLELLRSVQQSSLERMNDAEAVTEGRVKAGLAPPIDSNRARLRRIQQQAILADLDGQARESLVQLAVALGVTESLQLTDELQLPSSGPPPVAELVDLARSGRPELQTARLQLQAQERTVKVAQSSYFPQLSAFGSLQYGNNPLLFSTGARSASSAANPFSGLAGNLTLGAVLNMNFFDTLSTWSTVKDARFEVSRLSEEQRRAARTIESEVRVAHAKIEHLGGRRAPLAAAVEVARENAVILEGRYKNGDALVIEFLDGQNDLASAELQLVDVSAQLQLAWLELDAALGRTVGAH